jgi:phage gp29-like protein
MAKQKREELTTQIVDISSSMRSIAGYMDDTMDWLASIGESQSVFTKMMNDPKVESLVENRKDRVQQLYGSITDTGVARVDDACREFIDFNTIYKLNTILLNAIPYGIAIPEIVWGERDGIFYPEKFIPIPRVAINFSRYPGAEYGVPYLSSTNKPLNDPYRFIVHRNDKGDGNVWGTPALRSVYWPWKFKQLGFRFWIMAAERLGVPSVLAIFDTKSQADAEQRAEKLTKILKSMKSGSSGAMANIREIKVVESAIRDFDTIVQVCNLEISYGITAQSLMTSEAQYGTKAQGVLHEETYKSTTIHDAYLIQQSDQLLYEYFVQINFPGARVPRFDIDSTEYASWDVVKEAIDRNVPVSLNALYEKLHLPKPENENDVFLNTQTSLFSDPEKSQFFFQTRPKKSALKK